MSAYMPQPDSGDNCCDCPSRPSPCDDCGGTCCGCANYFDPALCFDGTHWWTGQTCEGAGHCSGELIPDDMLGIWKACKLNYTCCDSGGCSGTGGLEYVDPNTCEFAGDATSRGGCFPTVPGGCNTIVSAEGICKPGACCIDGSCSIFSAAECAGSGGVYQGDGTVCGGDLCDNTGGGTGGDSDGPCCVNNLTPCTIYTFFGCTEARGTWFGPGGDCGSIFCTTGACCFAAAFCPSGIGDCGDVGSESSCTDDLGGVVQGWGTVCGLDAGEVACGSGCCCGPGSCFVVPCSIYCDGLGTFVPAGQPLICDDSSCAPCDAPSPFADSFFQNN